MRGHADDERAQYEEVRCDKAKTKTGATFHWEQEDKVLQFIVVPVANIKLEQVDELGE